MKLFNKYKNKNFMYLTNYINSCISNEELALTPEELEYQLLGTSQSTFEEFIHAVFNLFFQIIMQDFYIKMTRTSCNPLEKFLFQFGQALQKNPGFTMYFKPVTPIYF